MKINTDQYQCYYDSIMPKYFILATLFQIFVGIVIDNYQVRQLFNNDSTDMSIIINNLIIYFCLLCLLNKINQRIKFYFIRESYTNIIKFNDVILSNINKASLKYIDDNINKFSELQQEISKINYFFESYSETIINTCYDIISISCIFYKMSFVFNLYVSITILFIVILVTHYIFNRWKTRKEQERGVNINLKKNYNIIKNEYNNLGDNLISGINNTTKLINSYTIQYNGSIELNKSASAIINDSDIIFNSIIIIFLVISNNSTMISTIDNIKFMLFINMFKDLTGKLDNISKNIYYLFMNNVQWELFTTFINNIEIENVVPSDNYINGKIVLNNFLHEYTRPDNTKISISYPDFNLDLSKKEKILLLGKSGCGKTTFIKYILGIYKSNSINMTNFINKRTYMRQSSSEIIELNNITAFNFITDNIVINNDIILQECKAKINELLVILKLEDVIKDIYSNIGKLSGGEMNRLILLRNVYRSLSYETELLILDEPDSGISYDLANQIFKDLFNNKSGYLKNKSVIIISHFQLETSMFDKVINF